MKEAEKKQIEELLKCLTYSTKTQKLAYHRKGETTFMQGSCVPRFKNDFKKLLNSFKIDPPTRRNRYVRSSNHLQTY